MRTASSAHTGRHRKQAQAVTAPASASQKGGAARPCRANCTGPPNPAASLPTTLFALSTKIDAPKRSEERRVGKECRARGRRAHLKKTAELSWRRDTSDNDGIIV